MGSQPLYGTESLRLFILGNDVGQLACKWSDNDVFVQAGEWLKVLPVKIEFMDSERLLIRREDGKRIELRANAQDVLIDGEIGKIEPAVTSVDGELFIPLKAFCGLLNLPFSFDAVNKVGYICAALLPVEVKQVEDGWRIEIPFTANTSYSINRLSGPERIYIDAANCLVSSQMHGEVIGRKGSIERIRVGQYSLTPPTARVVLDTDVKLGFQDITVKDAQGKTQRVVLFVRDLKVSKAGEARAKVSAVKLEPTNGIVRGLISVEGALRYRAFTLRDPYRIVIDFRGTELALPIGTQEIPKNEMVKEVRVGNPEVDGELVARVVFELFKPVRYRVIEKQAGGGLAVELGASSLSGVSIVIDPGHGGQDPGAISPTGMFKSKLVEKELTLDIALKLHKLLTNAGAIVTMTRYGDYYVSLEDRVYIANKLNPAAFVSIHLNSFPTPGAKSGTETYYFTPQSELLAGAIHKNLVATLGLPDNGIRQRRFYVLRNTNVPAVLIEACYLNHPVDGALVMDEQFREKIALAIFNGLEEYFSSR
ncbi:MAG: N-acetylmuramoyl-L-alanine amidase [Armatimonadota bacterium]|nr:N-acetylmuramoyl-L-alanine amidase [Armatimonadota bacterium]MCX7776524.1 N-acetylmuramoyl-L-alanine amidase [Armatimonadota bacterium]MDW8024323.1 N-acetylmuramoyl-L-alanine amidase [Armatimonadota bacterium]